MTQSAFVSFALTAFLMSAAPGLAGPAPALTAEPYGASRQAADTEQVNQRYDVEPGASFDLRNLAGSVRVTAGGGRTIRIDAVKRVRGRRGRSGDLEDVRVEMRHVGNRVEVRTQYPRGNDDVRASVDFTVTVPADTSVTLRTVSGDLSVAGVSGEVRVETVSGDVEVTDAPNVTVAKTVSGTVTARHIGSDAALSLGSVSGTVIASALQVRSLEAGTVSGDVRLTGVEVERLDAQSVSGNIEFEATLARGGRYTLNSHSGDVRVALAGSQGFEVDASTFSGSIRSDFPLTIQGDIGGRRGRGAHSIRGSVGDAGALLSIRSFSGTIVIEKR